MATDLKKNLPPVWGYKIRGLQHPSDEANNTFLDALQSEISRAEKSMYEAKLDSFLDTARGEWLDYWGSWLGLKRNSWENNDDYRQRLKDHVKHKRNTIDSIRGALAKFLKTNIENIYIYEPYRDMAIYNSSYWNTYKFYPSTYYRYAVIDVQIDHPVDEVTAELINLFRPAGVYWVLTSLVNVLDHNAPIIDFRPLRTKIGTTDIDYVNFVHRTANHLKSNFTRKFEIDDPFIYNNSLLNGGKVYYSLNRAITGVSWLGKSDTINPDVNASHDVAYQYTTHNSMLDNNKLSVIDNNGVSFDISGQSGDNIAPYADTWNVGINKNNIGDSLQTYDLTYLDENGDEVLEIKHDSSRGTGNTKEVVGAGYWYSQPNLKANQTYIFSFDVAGKNVSVNAGSEGIKGTWLAGTRDLITNTDHNLTNENQWYRYAVAYNVPNGYQANWVFYGNFSDYGTIKFKNLKLQEVPNLDNFKQKRTITLTTNTIQTVNNIVSVDKVYTDDKVYQLNTDYTVDNRTITWKTTQPATYKVDVTMWKVPEYTPGTALQSRTTLMGIVDLYNYFQDGNLIGDDYKQLVLNHLKGANTYSLILRMKQFKGNKVNAYIYDFAVKTWVSMAEFDLSDDYQFFRINLTNLKSYLNNQGIMFTRFVPENKQGSIDVDYYDFSFGTTSVETVSYAPSQTDLGAEVTTYE